MAGVTDRSFRALCREMSAQYATTEMISAKALVHGDRKTADLARFAPTDLPLAVQFFGAEPDTIARAVALLYEEGVRSKLLPTVVDLNMGCPMRKITSNGEGSALMRDPMLVGKIVRAAVGASPLPVTIKIRTGWDDLCKNAPEVAAVAEEAGAAMITVHGRSREQLYRPPVDRGTIAAVKRAVCIPVIANGGIASGEEALSMLRETGCDGIAVGQGALGNPFIFREISYALRGEPTSPPSAREVLTMARRHAALLVADKGEAVGVREFRRHFSHYVKGMRGAARARERVCRIKSARELLDFLDEKIEEEREESENS